MMSFCRKSVHSLLSLTTNNNHNHNQTPTNHHRDHHHLLLNPTPDRPKLGLITLVTDPTETAAGVLESSSLNASANAKSSPPPEKKDPGGIGFIDDIGGGVNGLMSCTESLGFESSDERRVDDDEVDAEADAEDSGNGGRESFCGSAMKRPSSSRRRRTGKEERKFPPPLSSLDRNGRPSFFLRPVRKDGRLELTEVRINRPEILRAYRGDGRLRLHFIKDEEEQDISGDNDDLGCIHEEPEIVQEDYDNINNNNNNNRLIINNNNSGEGFRTCHDEVNQNDNLHHHHHHHHENHLWRSQRHCVITTR